MHSVGKLATTWLLFIIDSLPVILPATLAVFGLMSVGLLLLGQLRAWYVWPLGLLVAAVAVYIVLRSYRQLEHRKWERHICNLLVGGGLLVWTAYNAYLAGQHLITNRDPGTYANAGLWLINHASLRIAASDAFGNVAGVSSASPGFGFDASGNLLAQGQHLLPVLLGLGGRMVGVIHIFQINVLFGAIALLAIYGFARLLVRPFWAMVATGVLAAAMPFIYFSRDTYTEPLAAAFTFGGLTLLWLALQSGKLSVWLLAGLVLGAGTLTRIDGFLTILCVVIFLSVMLVTAPARDRKASLRNAIVLVTGMAVSACIGWLDVSQLSEGYYQDIKSELYPVLTVAAAVIAVTAITAPIIWRNEAMLRPIDHATKAWRSHAAAAAVLLFALLLASRPLWYRGYDPTNGGTPTRNFAELSVYWVSWYIGPVMALLGTIGLALAAATVLQKRQLFLIASITVIGGTAAVYLLKPGIAPDQIWASRRLLPVILPGIAVFGIMALERLAADYLPKLGWRWLYMGMAAVALALAPLVTSRRLLIMRDTALLVPMQAICAAIPSGAAVLWLGTARSHFIQPTTELCGVPAEGYGGYFSSADQPSRQTLRQVAQNAQANGYIPVVALYGSESGVLPSAAASQLTTASGFAYQRLENPITNPPQIAIDSNDTILMGIIQPDGRVRPLQSGS